MSLKVKKLNNSAELIHLDIILKAIFLSTDIIVISNVIVNIYFWISIFLWVVLQTWDEKEPNFSLTFFIHWTDIWKLQISSHLKEIKHQERECDQHIEIKTENKPKLFIIKFLYTYYKIMFDKSNNGSI